VKTALKLAEEFDISTLANILKNHSPSKYIDAYAPDAAVRE
jgi:hypothetical protein